MTDADGPSIGESLEGILELVARERGIDLRDYRREVLERRVVARMRARRALDAPAYVRSLADDPAELDRLAAALLVHTTSFFRDPEVFETLRAVVLPSLAADPRRRIRAWVIGAATGEEAYSVAIALASTPESSGLSWEVLATDRDESSVAAARSGRYGPAALATLPEAARRDHFVDDGDAARASEALASRVTFAVHDLLGPRLAPREAIVAEFDLVLCRNVLIYLDDRSLRTAGSRIASVLRPGGALVLGLTELVPKAVTARFEPFPGTDPALRVFRHRRRSPESGAGPCS